LQPKKQYVITEDVKQKLLSTVDIAELISADIKLTRLSSKNMTACCPFHSENTPSFTVSTNKGFYHCFGCGAHGDAISWVMSYKGLDYVEAIVHLGEFANIEIPSITLDEKENFTELVGFNKWLVGKVRKQTEIDHSSLLPFLQKLILIKPAKDSDEDESFIADLISVKQLNVRFANDYSKVKEIQEVVALAKTFDALKGSKSGHLVRDKRGFVTGIAIQNSDSKSGYQFTPLPLGKKLNETILGIEQIKDSDTDKSKKIVLLFTNPEFYFLNRIITSNAHCLSHPVNSSYFSNEQLSQVLGFTDKKFAKDLFNGGLYIQVSDNPEDKEKTISTLKSLHKHPHVIEKGGVFFPAENIPLGIKPLEELCDSTQIKGVSFLDYLLNLTKQELRFAPSESLTAKQRFQILTKVLEILEISDKDDIYADVVQMYSDKLGLPHEIFMAAKDVTSTPLVKSLVGNSLQDLCFAIMCNRPQLAVEFHTQIESFMEKGLLQNEATAPVIYSDVDIGSKVGSIFIASSVCAEVIENLQPGATSIVEISKQLETDISKEFAINFIQLGIRHRAVVEQLPAKCSPFTLISEVNELINNFTQRINGLSIYDRYVVLASMKEGKLPMSSFAALTMDVVTDQKSDETNQLERN
jgi:hypothetical protein